MSQLRALLLVPVLCAAVGCATTGSGVGRVEPREGREFSAIRARGSVDVAVTVGPEWRVSVDCDDNLLPFIHTEVRSGVLVIDQDRGVNLAPRGRCAVDVTTPKLVAVDAHGSADVTIKGKVVELERLMLTGSGSIHVDDAAGARVALAATGSGGVHVERLAADDVALDLTGSGDVRVAGKAKTVRVRSSGSGDVEARGLAAESAVVESSGSSDVAVHAARKATVHASGSGGVRVAGNPGEREGRASGSSSIRYE